MDKFLVLKPFIRMISQGKFFDQIFAWILRILAVFAVLGFLYYSVKLWSLLSNGFHFKDFLALFLIQIVFAALAYALVNILLTRADDVSNLPKSTEYFATPIFVIFVKMVGEILCVFYALVGISVGLAIWIIGGLPMLQGMGMFSGGNGFLDGLQAIIGGPLVGFLFLSLFYYIGEQVGVLVDICKNTKK